MNLFRLLASFLLFFLMPLASYSSDLNHSVTVYFLKKGGSSRSTLIGIERKITPTKFREDAALRELFKGPTPQEAQRGLETSFFPKSVIAYNTECTKKQKAGTLKPLSSYYRGVTLKGNRVIINFAPNALCYLESTPAQSASVVEPIQKTLEQFKINEVQYAIDGKIKTDWDA